VNDPELGVDGALGAGRPRGPEDASGPDDGNKARQMGFRRTFRPQLHDAKFKRKQEVREGLHRPSPPEEVLISRETPTTLPRRGSLSTARLELCRDREMGYDVEDDIADYAPNADFNLERVERLKFDDALAYGKTRTRRRRPIHEASLALRGLCRVDYDGDGIAELRKVTKVGKNPR
jgi:hypothetical protein